VTTQPLCLGPSFDKDVKLGGASPGKQALAAGLCDEILIHLLARGAAR
jgi:hypothetical protein